jgi:L,D-transpeptidase ErfK/SrfK
LNTSSKLLARVVLAASLSLSAVSLAAQEGLPEEAPREGSVITVDVSTNQLYLFRDGELVAKSPVATGSDKVLKKGSKVWWFRTPRGRHKVVRRIADPVWRKPDWAFIEEGRKVPAPDSPKRFVKGKLGKYALDLGEGILIHGTDDPNSFGRKASHGCIRAPEEILATLWKEAQVGTEVVIFESEPTLVAGEKGLSDLEMLGVR